MTKIKGIKYVAPIFDSSGYGKAARGNILALHKQGVPLTLKPVSFETVRPDLGDDGRILNGLVDNDIDYNVVFIHTTPEFWSKHVEHGKTSVGFTIWETSKLHPAWSEYINTSVQKVLVGCSWNKDVFKESGVTIPIGVVPHGINMAEFDNVTPFQVAGVKDDTYMFYDIFQWCYDEKTRVLTKDGFKYFKELSYDDEIATLNLKTEELEYQKPEKIVSFRRKDKMMFLEGKQFDICVTPDHKMVIREKSESNWQLTPFNKLLSKGRSNQTIFPEKYRAKKNCKWNTGREKSVFKIPVRFDDKYPRRKYAPTEIPMDIFLEFLGWYLSEGSTYAAKRGYVNTITQIKEKYVQEIIDCINKMGFNPYRKMNKDIIFNSREMHRYLKQFGKAPNKFIPVWVKNLSSRQIKILLTSLFKGDGSSYKNGDWIKYVSTSKQLAEDVQECLLKIGLSGAVSTSDPTLKTPGKIGDRYIRGKLLQYTVSVNRESNEPSMSYAKLQEIDYDGFVYCATVPNHTMLVERNGKVLFSGNTERKNPLALIKAYWHEFKEEDNVALVLKTYRSNYDESEKEAIRTTIKRLKMVSPADYYPPIYLIPNMLSEAEILGLHARGDCYVSLDRGEGFGLSPAFSGAFGNPIIVTGYGGVNEYAKEDNSYLVDFSLTPCFGMPFSPWYRLDQLWAETSVKHGAELMRYVYENQEESKARGQKLKQYISENFTWEIIGKKIIEEIEKI